MSDADTPTVTRLECTEDGSSKFWEAWVQGCTFTARWGRIGSDGQTKAKDFPTEAKAAAELARLVKEKLAKGYVTIGAEPEPEPEPPKAKSTKAKTAKKAAAAAPEPAPEAPEAYAADPEGWVAAEDGYALRLVDGALVCRNDKGKVLASVPPKVKQAEVGGRMLALLDFLAAHEAECRSTVDGWMLGSLPVPSGLLAEVWPDPSWRGALENLVVAPVAGGEVALARAGLFRGVDPRRGLGLVNLDGESTWVDVAAVLVPHPILLGTALDDWRQLATELATTQAIAQLFRETFTRPDGLLPTQTALGTWSGGHFAQLNFALGRCRTLGYRVRGGFATCPVREPMQDLAVVEARYWIGAEYPDHETLTGELLWVDAKERPLPVASVGPVALSEGIRMAAAIYAGRQVKEDAA